MRGYKLLVVASLVFSSVNASAAASEADMRSAKRLYERMTGVKVSSKKPELKTVADLLALGKNAEAAKYITTTSDFLNVQIKNFSLRLSNKDESVKVPFNDFSALIVGVVRDNRDFREILTSDYYYDITGVANDDDLRTRYFNQNNFAAVETSYVDLTKALTFRGQQQMVTVAYDTPYMQNQKSYPLMTTKPNKEAAGVLTTRTFAERNLGGGSNRRAVEFSLKQFLCVSMAEAADSSASDQYVGRDVERFPAGDYNKYLTSCKSCHSVMDGMRGAFAKLDYGNFTNSAATGVYSQMHGDFFRDEGITAAYNKYVTDVVTPTINTIIPDLEVNQANSMYYKTRYDFLVARGSTAAQAKSSLDGVLNTVRDPKIATDLIADFRAKNTTLLADLKTNRNNATYRTTYVKACLDHFSNTALTQQQQEEKFLLCNLDNKKDMSLIYAHYSDALTAGKTSDAEKDRLLGKLINRGRATNGNMIIAYLQAKDMSKLYARNAFDTETGVATKMNKGSYPYGFVVKSDSFVNNAVLGSKSTFFGWRGTNKSGGNGPKDFGRMLGDSRRFSQCMAKRVYESVCLKKLESTQYTTLVRLGDRFEALNYNLKNLYQEIALDPVCGVMKGE
ncbi:hypothetical protein [Bdellovibrio sp. HCB-162]|uniref:hypothetical protein n=1 Tax=Bdellovibrio sp. HCB-162 TaxID=3394234 RepID=UPI0039BCDCCD